MRQLVSTAFYEWVRHFDTSAGIYTVNVTFQGSNVPIVGANAAAIYGDAYLTVGNDRGNGRPEVAPAFGPGVAARSGVSPSILPLTLFINPFSQANVTGSILPPLEREFGHALGIRSFCGVSLTQPYPAGTETTYDLSVRGVEAGRFGPSSAPLAFYGAERPGGPVPLSNADAANPVSPDGSFIDPSQIAPF